VVVVTNKKNKSSLVGRELHSDFYFLHLLVRNLKGNPDLPKEAEVIVHKPNPLRMHKAYRIPDSPFLSNTRRTFCSVDKIMVVGESGIYCAVRERSSTLYPLIPYVPRRIFSHF
jgi:hypothetical protein